MPGGTARLRVSGAITRRLGSVIGPSLKGSKSLDWLISGLSDMEDERELGIAGICARRKPYARRILPPHDPAHMAGVEKQRVAVDVGGFIRNQEQRSIGHLPAGALSAERHCDSAIGPAAA